MPDQPTSRRRALMIGALIGILIELVAIFLIASRRLVVPVGMLLLMTGLCIGIAPMMIAGRKSQR